MTRFFCIAGSILLTVLGILPLRLIPVAIELHNNATQRSWMELFFLPVVLLQDTLGLTATVVLLILVSLFPFAGAIALIFQAFRSRSV